MQEHKKETQQSWVETAIRGIRFKPDRAAVEAELRDHIWDKIADLRRIFPDTTYEEAEERALSQMGDAGAIGKELAKIHRPWLGWLWRASQVALGVTMAAVVIVGLMAFLGGGTGWFLPGEGFEPRDLKGGISGVEYMEPCPDREVIDGRWITRPQAAMVEWKNDLRLGVVLRAVSPRFWERESRNLRHRIRAVDSLGNEYPSYEERWNSLGGNTEEWKYVSGSPDGRSPFHRDYVLWVNGIDPAAEWVRLDYDWLGRSFSMTVDLKEAGT